MTQIVASWMCIYPKITLAQVHETYLIMLIAAFFIVTKLLEQPQSWSTVK